MCICTSDQNGETLIRFTLLHEIAKTIEFLKKHKIMPLKMLDIRQGMFVVLLGQETNTVRLMIPGVPPGVVT